jgi:ABC-type uncharacterized transport system involved in gliding motility auxiliary subunit
MGISVVFYKQALKRISMKLWPRRSSPSKTKTLLNTLGVLALVGLLNLGAARSVQKIDLTENQLFTLAPESQRLLENLRQPLKVWLWAKNIPAAERELLQKYQEKSPYFTYEVLDPEQNPGLAQEFKQTSQGTLYRVYLETAQKKQPLRSVKEDNPLNESQLTNALQSLNRTSTLKVYFLQGHGEYPLESSQAINSLKDKGYQVEPLLLAQKTQIPADAAAIAIVGPKRPLFAEEVAALSKYSQKGGNLLILLDPQVESNLKPLLDTWGVKLDQRVIIDGSGAGELAGLGPGTPIITTYGQHPITRDFGNGITVFPLARPIATVAVPGVEAISLLVTNEQMWAESDLKGEQVTFDPPADLAGPFDLGVALTRGSSKLVIIGNSRFISDGLFGQQLNGDVFLNAVQWLANSEQPTLSIRPKEAKNRRLNLTPLTANLLLFLALLFVPLLGFIGAGITWWRRR